MRQRLEVGGQRVSGRPSGPGRGWPSRDEQRARCQESRGPGAGSDLRVSSGPGLSTCLSLASPDTTQTVPEDGGSDLIPPLELCIRTK